MPVSSRLPITRVLDPAPGRPIPLWMIYPILFTGVYLSHLTLLRLPYYWDEAGYYIPAAWDFFRTGSLIPSSTLTNAHPPLPSVYLALWWHASGYMPAVTRVAMCFVTALALLAVYQLSLVLSRRPQVAAASVLLTAVYPVWFAQSTLAHADMFAAAGTLWALAFALHPAPSRCRLWYAVACFSLAALSKETAIVTPLALAACEAVLLWRDQPSLRRKHLAAAALWLLPLLPLACWYAFHRYRTGYIFGNPAFLQYNATANLTPLRILVAFAHRIMHVTAHMNLFVPVLCTCAAMMLDPRSESDGSLRPRISLSAQWRIYAIILANIVFFSVLGGALLTRYLLPLYPLILLVCVSTFRRRVRYWPALVAFAVVAFITGIFINPPYRFAPEDNLAYRDVIQLHQQAIHQVIQRFPGATVLTAWPVSDELTKPELGYVRTSVAVVPINNFSMDELQKLSLIHTPYTVGLVFSTKYDPPRLPFNLGPRNEAFDARYFDFHRDLPPTAIAHLLGGDVIWHAERNGQWVAVIHFNRAQEALAPASSPLAAHTKIAFAALR